MDISNNLLGIVIIGAGTLFLLVFSLDARSRKKQLFRVIPGISKFIHSVGSAVEDGSRVHVSLGSAPISGDSAGPGLAGMSLLEGLAPYCSQSDYPPAVTSGEGSLGLLSREVLWKYHDDQGISTLFDPDGARITGSTPFAYALGAIPVIRHYKVSANIFIGNFGPEVAFLCEAGRKESAYVLGGSDSLPSQAVLFASAEELLIGEEVYALPAYFNKGKFLRASLRAQDMLRWALILFMLYSVFNIILETIKGGIA